VPFRRASGRPRFPWSHTPGMLHGMSTVRVTPEHLRPQTLPHVCVVSGVPTDRIRKLRAPRTIGTGSVLLFGAFAPFAAAFGGIDVYLPFAPDVFRRRRIALAVMAAAPLVAVAALAAGVRDVALIAVAFASIAAVLAAAIVRQRRSPEVHYDAADDTVLVGRAHPAFVAALRPPS